MNYQALNLIDQIYTNIDLELNDQMLISNNNNETIKEVIYNTSNNVKKTKKQLTRDKDV